MPNILHDKIEDWDYCDEIVFEYNMQIETICSKFYINGVHRDEIEQEEEDE